MHIRPDAGLAPMRQTAARRSPPAGAPTSNGAGTGAVVALAAVDEAATAGGAQVPVAPYIKRHRSHIVRVDVRLRCPTPRPVGTAPHRGTWSTPSAPTLCHSPSCGLAAAQHG